jgi:OmpA-OmpF porin, OOP family
MTTIRHRLSRGNPTLATFVLAIVAGCSSLPRDVPTQPDGLAGVTERFGRDQQALEALAASNPALRRTHDWARAQCFVQHAYSERHENENTGFVAAALDQAEAIADALRDGRTAPATQLIGHTERMRPDLWARAERLRGDRCAQATAGCLEVQLVRAGHEYSTIGWRHATSHFAIAEDLAARAEHEAADCAAAAAATSVAGAPAAASAAPATDPQPQPPVLAAQTISLGADVLFRFDRFAGGELLDEGRRQLDSAAARLRGVELRSVRVIGHADPLGSAAYNLRLSQRRAETVKALLVQRGVPAERIAAEGRGKAQLLALCNQKTLRGTALQACHQPNRRVVIEFSYVAARP